MARLWGKLFVPLAMHMPCISRNRAAYHLVSDTPNSRASHPLGKEAVRLISLSVWARAIVSKWPRMVALILTRCRITTRPLGADDFCHADEAIAAASPGIIMPAR